MNIKEKPLIDAVSKLGPLPGFLFSSPFVAGFVSIIMCAVFGAFIMLFQVAGRGGVEPLEIFESMRWGAIVVVAIGAVIHIGIAVSAFREREEMRVRLLFVFGGISCIAALAAADWLALEALREWLATLGPIV